MKRTRSLVAILLALLWMPATSHCLLEDAGLIHKDKCCESTNSQNDADHDAADGVCQIESSTFRLPKPVSEVLEIFFSVISSPSVLRIDAALRRTDRIIGSGTSPPAILGRTWQFSFRTALPARAPSLIS